MNVAGSPDPSARAFEPWVGSRYHAEGLDGVKLLILGNLSTLPQANSRNQSRHTSARQCVDSRHRSGPWYRLSECVLHEDFQIGVRAIARFTEPRGQSSVLGSGRLLQLCPIMADAASAVPTHSADVASGACTVQPGPRGAPSTSHFGTGEGPRELASAGARQHRDCPHRSSVVEGIFLRAVGRSDQRSHTRAVTGTGSSALESATKVPALRSTQ